MRFLISTIIFLTVSTAAQALIPPFAPNFSIRSYRCLPAAPMVAFRKHLRSGHLENSIDWKGLNLTPSLHEYLLLDIVQDLDVAAGKLTGIQNAYAANFIETRVHLVSLTGDEMTRNIMNKTPELSSTLSAQQKILQSMSSDFHVLQVPVANEKQVPGASFAPELLGGNLVFVQGSQAAILTADRTRLTLCQEMPADIKPVFDVQKLSTFLFDLLNNPHAQAFLRTCEQALRN